MRWFVEGFSHPDAHGPSTSAHAQPPGPGFPLHAPSVYTVFTRPGNLPPSSGRTMDQVIFDGFSHQLPDTDPSETAEWIDSFDDIVETHGKTRARFLLMKLLERARETQIGFPATVSTPYINTIPRDDEPWFPGDEFIERRIRAFIRWNAAVMVTRANARSEGIGGHLSTFASSASLYEVGFNHFFRGKDDGQFG